MPAAPRVRLLLAVLVLPLLVPASARGEEDAVEKRKRELLLRLRVHRAIDRGAVWLADQGERDGSFALDEPASRGPVPPTRHALGECALATYTLAHCGYTKDRNEIRKAVGYLRRHYRSAMKGDFLLQASSYSLSLTVLALHTLYAETPEPVDADDAERYGRSLRSRRNPCGYPGWARSMIEDILDWLLEHRAEKGLFRYPGGLGAAAGPGRGPGGGPRGGGPPPGLPDDVLAEEDLSNTQYVLLALWAGARCGYEIEEDVLREMAERLLSWQASHGPEVPRRPDPAGGEEGHRYGNQTPRDRARGFGYTPSARPTGSMTTAGLSSLAILKAIYLEQYALDAGLRARIEAGMWDAIAWLTENFTVHGNPPGRNPTWHYYYLYGLERACEIAGKSHLGDHDWYAEGATLLVGAQQEDGRWAAPSFRSSPGGGSGTNALRETCFALLFLERAALAPKEPLLPRPTVTPGPR